MGKYGSPVWPDNHTSNDLDIEPVRDACCETGVVPARGEPVAWRVDGKRQGRDEVWFYWKPKWPVMHEEHGDKVTPLYASPVHSGQKTDDKLPCDVHLPPVTIIRKGCSFHTLMLAINQRQNWEDSETRFREPAPAPSPGGSENPPYEDLRKTNVELMKRLREECALVERQAACLHVFVSQEVVPDEAIADAKSLLGSVASTNSTADASSGTVAPQKNT